ncbi:MAG TPA: hypothetical protein VHT27_02990 [Solirubrobacteraceae bacterium]|nr:hypothetical protein [Solirubrobacteraceae bacterium]
MAIMVAAGAVAPALVHAARARAAAAIEAGGAQIGSSASRGSSCADPWTDTLINRGRGHVTGPSGALLLDYQVFAHATWVEWGLLTGTRTFGSATGYQICSVEVHHLDGTTSRSRAYERSALGGEYVERRSEARSRFDTLSVSFAHAPTPAGRSCAYPFRVAKSEAGDSYGFTHAYTVRINELHQSHPHEGDNKITLQIEVIASRPKLELCNPAVLEIERTVEPPEEWNPETRALHRETREYRLSKVSSTVWRSASLPAIPYSWNYVAVVYARG